MRLLFRRPAVTAGAIGLLCGLAWLAGPAAAGGKKGGPALKVKEGEKAPEVELPATSVGTVLPDKKDAKALNLKDLQGKKNVVLYFYPKALTGG